MYVAMPMARAHCLVCLFFARVADRVVVIACWVAAARIKPCSPKAQAGARTHPAAFGSHTRIDAYTT